MVLALNSERMVVNMKANTKKEKSTDLELILEMMDQSMLETEIMVKFQFMYFAFKK